MTTTAVKNQKVKCIRDIEQLDVLVAVIKNIAHKNIDNGQKNVAIVICKIYT